jgi:hypothetical protein
MPYYGLVRQHVAVVNWGLTCAAASSILRSMVGEADQNKRGQSND